jgi:polyphenol oxidase
LNTLDIINTIRWIQPQEVQASVPTHFQLGFCGIPTTNPGMVPDAEHPVVQSKQIHGTNITRVNSTNLHEEFVGDGLQTSTQNLVLTITTADCLPILAGRRERSVIAAHAGWRGVVAGMTSEILRTFDEDQIPAAKVEIWIGPAIGPGNFEVGPEVISGLRKALPFLTEEDFSHSIHKGARDRWFADLQTIAALAFCRNGARPENIVVVRSCTYKNTQHWYSFRRTGSSKPSNLGWIQLTPQRN